MRLVVHNRDVQKKSAKHFLRSSAVTDCQTGFYLLYSLQSAPPGKMFQTFLCSPAICGLWKAVLELKESAIGVLRKKVADI